MTYKVVFDFKKGLNSWDEISHVFHRFFGALPKCETSCSFYKGKAYAYGIDEQNKEIIRYLLRDLKGRFRFYKEVK